MHPYTILRVSTRVSADKKANFSMSKFLYKEKATTLVSISSNKSEYFGKHNDLIGHVYLITIGDHILSKAVQDFVNSFLSESPYKFIECITGIFTQEHSTFSSSPCFI